MRYLVVTLVLALCFWVINPLSVSAQSLGDYFDINYNPVSLSENEIQGSSVFHATVSGNATCTNDLPVSVDEATIISRVIAENTISSTRVILNESYTLKIKPFPSKEGESTEIKQVILLQFPAEAESGDYNIIGELIEAKVKVAFMDADVTGYLPQDQFMGSVKYIAPETIPRPVSKPTLEPESERLPAPVPATVPIPMEPKYHIPWWVWLIVAIAVATTVLNIVWYLRHRTT